jgi:hypothetical protein
VVVIYYKKQFEVLEMKRDKRLLLLLALVVVGALLFNVIPASAGENPGRGKSLAVARKALEQELSPLVGAGFVGIAHSEAEGEIIVFAENEQAKQKVPHSFEGYPVRIEVTGKMQLLSNQVAEPLAGVSPARRDVAERLVGGISLSAYATEWSLEYAGTLGMVTYDNKILSNAHVIAMNPETNEFLAAGATIIQPGSLDEGRSDDRVGELESYIPIDFGSGAENYADAAIASVDEGIEASPGEQFSEAGDYWIQGWTNVSTGDIVRKSGRTTGVTTGEVLYTDASFSVSYGSRLAYFVDLIVVAQDNYSFAQRGDSGSAVDKDGEFVGLLFAGVPNAAVICKAQHIVDGLGIAVEPQGYSLTVSSTLGGSVITPGQGRFPYDENEVVDLVAVNETHYHFVEWTGDVGTIADVYDPTTTITVNGNYKITAKFELDPGWYSLTISSTDGGSVTDPGEGILVYPASANISLVAEADVGNHYHFEGWTGNTSTVGNVTAAETTIDMNASYSITANFELDPGWCSLTISSTDGGSVANPGEGTFVYPASANIGLLAQPNEGYEFVEWTGSVSTVADVDAATTTIAMNDSYAITANFESVHPQPKALLTVSSTIGGAVTDPGEGIFSYALGAEVDLVAYAVSGYHFTGWSGNVSTIADVSASSTTIAMYSSYSIQANFSGGSSRCFIATAAYGTPMAEEIEILRGFRDEYLLTNPVGKILVGLYYRVSPPIAEFITEHPRLKPVVRTALLPAVALSTIALNTSSVEKMVIVGLLVLISVIVAVWVTRRRGRGPEYT